MKGPPTLPHTCLTRELLQTVARYPEDTVNGTSAWMHAYGCHLHLGLGTPQNTWRNHRAQIHVDLLLRPFEIFPPKVTTPSSDQTLAKTKLWPQEFGVARFICRALLRDVTFTYSFQNYPLFTENSKFCPGTNDKVFQLPSGGHQYYLPKMWNHQR